MRFSIQGFSFVVGRVVTKCRPYQNPMNEFNTAPVIHLYAKVGFVQGLKSQMTLSLLL